MARRTLPFALIALAAAALVVPCARLAQASDKQLEVLSPEELAKAPSHRYATMTRSEAIDALRERGAIFDEVPAEKAPGVVAPIRLTSRLGGVHFHGMLRGEAAVTTPFEIADARLALALSDFAVILQKHGVNEVIHFSMYRPGGGGGVLKSLERPSITKSVKGATAARGGVAPGRTALPAPNAAPAATAHGGEPGAAAGRHPAALAIDVAALRKEDGTTLTVAKDLQAHLGAKTCGEGVAEPEDAAGKELHAIACEAAAAHIFTYILTPNFNAAHRDHFHMEVKPGVSWMLVH